MTTLNKSLLLIALSISIILGVNPANAQRVMGNKKITKETRDIEPFTGLDVGGAFNVYLTQQENTSLIVEADENLMERISTTVRGGTLHIKSDDIKNAAKLNIYLSTATISDLDVSGAANLQGLQRLSWNWI